jgi:small subunit ribosomal protein S6
MNLYDGLFILDIQGKDEGLKELLDVIEKEINTLSGKIQGTQKMDRRKFERVAGDVESGFYVNITFELAPAKLENLRAKFKLNPLIFRQFYLKKEPEAVPA